MQLPQSVTKVEAATVPNLPAAHWVQEEEPVVGAYDPGKQLVQAAAPNLSLKVPIGHDGHEEPDLYVPGMQLPEGATHTVDPVPVVVNPESQFVHTAPATLE